LSDADENKKKQAKSEPSVKKNRGSWSNTLGSLVEAIEESRREKKLIETMRCGRAAKLRKGAVGEEEQEEQEEQEKAHEQKEETRKIKQQQVEEQAEKHKQEAERHPRSRYK
jgi:hypothetical protein